MVQSRRRYCQCYLYRSDPISAPGQAQYQDAAGNLHRVGCRREGGGKHWGGQRPAVHPRRQLRGRGHPGESLPQRLQEVEDLLGYGPRSE